MSLPSVAERSVIRVAGRSRTGMRGVVLLPAGLRHPAPRPRIGRRLRWASRTGRFGNATAMVATERSGNLLQPAPAPRAVPRVDSLGWLAAKPAEERTVDDVIRMHLNQRWATLKEKTRRNLRADHVKRVRNSSIGATSIATLTPADVDKWLAELADVWSVGTIDRARAMLQAAYTWYYQFPNPAARRPRCC